MLSLAFKRSKSSKKGLKNFNHDLYLFSRGTATYITERGDEINFVEQSGLSVPEYHPIGSISFLDEDTVNSDFEGYSSAFVRRADERWGTIYALQNEVSEVFDALKQAIEEFEAHEVDIKALCPHAQTDIAGPVSVSVADMGTYFNKFDHFPGTGIHNNYHSARKRSGEEEDIIFLPSSATVVLPSTEHRHVC